MIIKSSKYLSPMKTLLAVLGLVAMSTFAGEQTKPAKVEHYSAENRVRSGIALGGIGTGSVELRKNGQFYNWSIFNNQPHGTGPAFKLPTKPNQDAEDALQFFLVRYQEEGGDVKIKLLQLNNSVSEAGMYGIDYYYPWMSGVKNIEYSGRFPFVNMKFTDPDMPFDIALEAFSPFIPHDKKNSALPGAYFNFTITSTSTKKVDVMLIASQRNLVGYDEVNKFFKTEAVTNKNYQFFSQTVGGMDKSQSSYGQMGMASLSKNSSYALGWEHKHPYYEKLLVENKFPNNNDTPNRNIKNKETGQLIARRMSMQNEQRSFSSIAVNAELKANKTFKHSFVMAWNFPNNYGSHFIKHKGKRTWEGDYTYDQKITKNQGHYYSNFFKSAAEVTNYLIENKKELTDKTRKFVDDFYQSDAEQFVLDQVNSNLNTFVTSSTFIKNGNFGIREGLSPDKSWGPNTTIDVSLYGSSSIINLFPELQKPALKTHKALQTKEGEINHGLGNDLDFTRNGTWGVNHRVDLAPNYIQLVMRDFFYTNDKKYLQDMWPSLKKAANYILKHSDKDNDQMPDMTGIMCSYDNFPMYGLASYIQSQWIVAMKSLVEGAKVMGDVEAQAKYHKIYLQGSALMDEHLWNGKYYSLSKDYTGLATGIKGATKEDKGILTDQIIGQWVANQSNLGYMFKKENVRSALQTIYDASFKKGFGLRNATWPEYPDYFPIHKTELWVDQANTPWSGVELAFASFLIDEGFYDEGLNVIKEVDNRYRKAGLYWDHQEFGGHYYRPMSAWQIINSLLGLRINQGHYSFSPKLPKKNFTLFFAVNKGTAHFIKNNKGIEIVVLSGEFAPSKISIEANNLGSKAPNIYKDNRRIKAKVSLEKGFYIIAFDKPITLNANQKLVIK